MRSEAIPPVHTTVALTMFALRDEKPLARRDRRVVEPVRLLQLPDTRAWVSPVPGRRNRPQSLPRDDGVVLWPRPGTGIPRENGPDEHGDEDHDGDTTEHVFAL